MKVAGAPISWGVSELEREASALAASSAEVLVPEDMETFLEMTQVDLCLDTGHVFLGGADPGPRPGVARREVYAGAAALEVTPQEAADLFAQVRARL